MPPKPPISIAFDARLVTWSGIGTYSLNLLRELAAGQERLGLRLLGLRRPEDGWLEEEPALAQMEWRLVEEHPWSPQGSLAAGRAARADADVFHVPHITIPTGFAGPLVSTVHDLIPLTRPESMPGRLRRAIFLNVARLAVRRSEVVLTISRHTAEEIHLLLGRPRALRFAPGAVDEAFNRRRPPEIEDVRHKYGLSERYVLWVGAFKPHKNLPALLRAWAALPSEVRSTTQLVLAGKADTAGGRATRALAADLGLQESVKFPGFVPEADLPALYSGAAAFVFPSLAEGFGLPPLEAMACGCPVLASNRTSLPEVLAEAALYADPDDPGELSRQMQRLLTDEYVRAQLSSAGLKQAARYSWTATAEETAKAYREALARARSRNSCS